MLKSMSLSSELEKFDPRYSLSRAMTPPDTWYTRQDFCDLERETIFSSQWLYAGRVDLVREVGSFFTGELLGRPYLVVRGQDQKLRGFFNVCRHHATCVAQGAGQTQQLVCPYHGWTYELDGRLRKAPQMEGSEGFDPLQLGLRPIEVQEWGPWVFLRFQKGSETLDSIFPGLLDRMNAQGLGELRFFKKVQYPLKCNWKVFIDNYLDGGYHLPQLHPQLSRGLDLSSYQSEVFDRHSIQSCSAKGSERLGKRAFYAWLYPNFMVNRYGELMDTNWVIPIDSDHCEVVFEYYASSQIFDRAESFLKDSDQVQKEDLEICERVQKGLASGAFDQGRYSPQLEEPAYRFHQRLFHDLTGLRV